MCIIFICVHQQMHPSQMQHARESIPRLSAPFPTQVDFVPAPPPLGGEKGNTDRQGTPSVMSVHRWDNLFVLPSQENELPQLANLLCSVPVPVPVSVPAPVSGPVSDPISGQASVPVSIPVKHYSCLFCHFYLLFLRSHYYSWINLKRSFAIILTKQL